MHRWGASVHNGSSAHDALVVHLELFDLLPVGHQKTLRVVSAGGSVYGAAAEVLDLASGTARGAVNALLGNGYLVRDDDRLRIVDPLLADWIRRRLPV